MSGRDQLPRFIEPMLCKPGAPFDSDAFLFEVKWDGTRALAFVEAAAFRLMNRREVNMTERYPDLAVLARLPAGTVLDGEVIVFKDGKAHLPSIQQRTHVRTPLRVKTTSRAVAATYVAFDLLYLDFKSVMARPLSDRRATLARLIKPMENERLILSEGVTGNGVAYYKSVCDQGLEGIVAKRLASKYAPGKRNDDWLKIKRRQSAHCVVIGYLPDRDDFRSLVIASNIGGELTCVGKVGTGFNESTRRTLLERLAEIRCRTPVIPCPEKAKWVEPSIYCVVSYSDVTENGTFRDPVFEKLIE